MNTFIDNFGFDETQEDQIMMESYFFNWFKNKILLHNLGTNPEMNMKIVKKFLKLSETKFHEIQNSDEYKAMSKKKRADSIFPVASIKFSDGQEIYITLIYDYNSFTPAAATELTNQETNGNGNIKLVLLYPNFFDANNETKAYIMLHEIGHIRLGHTDPRNSYRGIMDKDDEQRRIRYMINGDVVYTEVNADLYAMLNGAKMYSILDNSINKDFDKKGDYRYTNSEIARRYSKVWDQYKKLRRGTPAFYESGDMNQYLRNDYKIIRQYGCVDDDNRYNPCIIIEGIDRPLRGRSEVIVFKDKSIYGMYTKKGNFKIPGGAWNEGEIHSIAAKRECEEEAKITCDNLIYCGSYIKRFNQPPDWAIQTIPKNMWWYGYYVDLFIADYAGIYKGYVDPVDQDDLAIKGGFHLVKDIIDDLKPEYQEAIRVFKPDLVSDSFRESSDVYTESLIIPEKDFIINFDKWDYGTPLWITGTSGDGKSTLAVNLADQYNAVNITTDLLLMRLMRSKEKFIEKTQKYINNANISDTRLGIRGIGIKIAFDFINQHPEIPYEQIHMINGIKNLLPGVAEKYFTMFCDWIIEVSKTKYRNLKLIVEGCDITEGLSPEYAATQPLIVLGNSRLKSFMRRVTREMKESNEPFVKLLFKEIKKYNAMYRELDDNKDRFASGVKRYTNDNGHSISLDDIRKFEPMKKESTSLIDSINEDYNNFFMEGSGGETHILRDGLYPIVEKTLSVSTNDKLFKNAVEHFVDRNAEKLHEPCPITLIAFTDIDKQKFYDIFKIQEQDITAIINQALLQISDKAQFKLVKQNPIFTLFYMCIRFYTLKNDTAGINASLIIHALSSYPSIFSKYFPHGANASVMVYTADHLTDKFIFKQEGHVFGALRKSIQSSYKFLKPYFKDASDKEVIRYIQRVRNDQNSMIKKICSEYNKNYKAGNAVTKQNETYDTGEIIDDYQNNTSIVEVTAQKVVSFMLTNGIDLKLLETAAAISQLSIVELRLYLFQLLVEENTALLDEFITSVLFVYLYDEKHSVAEIKSRQFLSFGIELFRKTNSNNKNIATIKKALDTWGEQLGIHSKYRREATRISYKKGIYWYILLTIQSVV